MTVFSFALSHAAADVLWEDLELGSRPYPFDFPYLGRTHDERRGIRNAVYRDLESRGLAVRGRVSAEVEEALTLLVRFDYSLNAIASLDPKNVERQLLARSGARGEVAALAVLDDRQLKVDTLRSSALLRAVVDLIPPGRPGPGQSVTVPVPTSAPPAPSRRDDDFDSATFTQAMAPRSTAATQVRALEAVFERPRLRAGQFGVTVRGRHGREQRAPQVGWFDNDQGRYLSQTKPGQDGRKWLTHAPADNARIASQLAQELTGLLA
ncbi:ESX secretion-associated protein EspG [Saccharothrix australiensis]|uniref:ESAT-6 protein secretion system EspG family protein n=1 Tax=Saccharothrix australiensis TaxID=2072 RepID=A0A495VQE6_9PSEU|nr:ESX secretion-associated protein EspG [Saccharothrix australiensis]RKT51524.1 ESAT-6 protein secretion system EspG family protein [Saccharothrix australiensis]